jgi:hypothetical protein
MPKVKPLKPDEGISAEVFFDLVPSIFEPEPTHGTVTVTCSVCGRKMRPLALARPDEPTTKLRARMWVMRRWLELPWEGKAFCPRHLPQFRFWHPSFDFSERSAVAATPPTFKRPEETELSPSRDQGVLF